MDVFWVFFSYQLTFIIILLTFHSVLCDMPQIIIMFTISSRKYRVIYFRSSGMSVFPYGRASFLFSLSAAMLGWMERQASGNSKCFDTCHVRNDKFLLFFFPSSLLIPSFRLLTGHLIFPDFKREQGYRPQSKWPQGDIPLIERVMVLPPFAIWQLAFF